MKIKSSSLQLCTQNIKQTVHVLIQLQKVIKIFSENFGIKVFQLKILHCIKGRQINLWAIQKLDGSKA